MNFVLASSSVKSFSLLYLSGWNINISFLYANLTSFRQEVMVFPRVLKWFEITLLERGEGGVGEWLDEERKEGGDEGGNLFQSQFSLSLLSFQSESSQSACFDSKLLINSIHLVSSKASWAQLLKLPAGSTLEIILSMSLIKECRTVIFGLPKRIFTLWKGVINLAGIHLHGIRIIFQ